MRYYLAVGYDHHEIHVYQLRVPTASLDRARTYFQKIVQENGWEPFQRIEVFSLKTKSHENIENILTLTPTDFQ